MTNKSSENDIPRTSIKQIEIKNEEQENIVVCGWVRTKRGSKKLSFIELNDGSTINSIQIIADASLPNYDNEIKKITTGTSLRIQGKLVNSPGQGQKYEIQAKSIKVYGYADPEKYPIQKKDMSNEFLRENSHLRIRTNLFSAIFRVRSELAFAVHKFFKEKNFFYIHTPIITGSDCEGAGETFNVTTLNLLKVPIKEKKVDYTKDFFGKKANLTVSGQLEGELFALGLGNIYTFGPTFRSENSNTYRHASEFWMIEPEMAFYELDELMDTEEEFVKYLINHLLKYSMDDLNYLDENVERGLIQRLKAVSNNEFKRITYTQAIDILIKSSKKFEVDVEWGIDLVSEHERYLSEEHFKCPLIIYDYPKDIKAFYMKVNQDNKTVRGTDVIVPGIGEIIGGSQREDNLDTLLIRIKEMGLDEKSYWWYIDSRKFGTAPHSGFGLGFDRFLMFVTGVKNIRDVIPFPRTPNHLEF